MNLNYKLIFFTLLIGLTSCKSDVLKNGVKSFAESNIERLADSTSSLPVSQGVVSDYENIFDQGQLDELTRIILEYEKETTREFAVLTIDSISPYSNLNVYTTDLGNYWGIGKEDSDNGVLVVLSKSLRQVRIGTGYGTEKILTDSICKNVIQNVMIPQFKEDNYFKGVKEGIITLIENWD